MCAGIGISRLQDAAAAGREAVEAAVAALAGEPPALVVVFTTPRYDLPALLASIRSATDNTILIGATGSGEIVQGQCMGFGAGVAVLTLTAGPYRFGAASAAHIRNDLDLAGQSIIKASRAAAGDSTHAAVMLLADSLLGDLQQLVQGVYRITGPKVSPIGGAAGDEQKFVRTFVFHNDSVLEEGAVALWIAGDSPLRVITKHGWEPIGVPLLITRAEGTQIIEIGGKGAREARKPSGALRTSIRTSEPLLPTATRPIRSCPIPPTMVFADHLTNLMQ